MNQLKKILLLVSLFIHSQNYNNSYQDKFLELSKNYMYSGMAIMGLYYGPQILNQIITPYFNAWNNQKQLLNNLKIIHPNSEKSNFDLIAGYTDIKNQLRKKIKALKKQKYNKTKMNGMLLYGPPGNGKTNFVISLASEAGVPIILLNINDLMARPEYLLENFEIIFNTAQKMGPCILFIDEIDLLVKNRLQYQLTDTQDRILTMMLQKLDGLMTDGNKGVLIIGCTNNINFIDEAMYRSGRLGQKILINKPSEKDIAALFEKYFFQYKTYQQCLNNNQIYAKMNTAKLAVVDVLDYIKDLTELIDNTKPEDLNQNNNTIINDIILELNKEFGLV